MSHGRSHFLSVSCTSSRSMCYVSPLSHGANIFHQTVQLAIPGLLGPQWAIGATIWNTSCPDLAIYGRSVSPMSPGSYFISMVCTTSHGMHYASNRGQHLSKFYTSSHSGCSGSSVSRRSHCMSYDKISTVLHVLCPHSAHLTTMACVSSHSMCNVSPVSPGGHHTSTSCTSSHAVPSGAPVSHVSHYMNHIKIYPFFRRFMSPMSPRSHFISMSYTYSRSMHYVSPLSPGSHQASTPFTFSWLRRSRSSVSQRSHYMNQVKSYPFSDVLCPHWALGATSCQCHIHIAVRCTMCPHWAPGATRTQCP